MANLHGEIHAVLVILGIATAISLLIYAVFRDNGLWFCFWTYLLAVLLLVKEAPLLSYLTIAIITLFISYFGMEDGKRGVLDIASLILLSLVKAAVIFWLIDLVSGLFGSSGGGACTRASLQFC